MHHFSVTMLLFVSLCQRLITDLADGLLTQLTPGFSIAMILLPALLSGAIALLVKYGVAMRILPRHKLVSGTLPVLVISWYIDRICENNAYLLVRSVGLAIILCAALGVVIVSEDRVAGSRPQVETDAGEVGEHAIARD